MWVIRVARAGTTAEAVLQWTVDDRTSRKACGHTIADFQNNQFKLAEMHAEITVLRTFVDRCIELRMQKGPTADDLLHHLDGARSPWRSRHQWMTDRQAGNTRVATASTDTTTPDTTIDPARTGMIPIGPHLSLLRPDRNRHGTS